MKVTREELGKMYKAERGYISYQVYIFMQSNNISFELREDLEAECALHFMNIVEKYDGESSKFSTFLMNQLRYYMLNYIRKEIKISNGEQDLAEEFRNNPPDTNEFYGFEAILEDGGCTQNQKEILRYYFILGEIESWIAQEMGVTQQAISNTILRALKKMKKRLV